jgi:hypothetical protein
MIHAVLIANAISVSTTVATQLPSPTPEIVAQVTREDRYLARNVSFPNGVRGIPGVIFWNPAGYRPLKLDLYLPSTTVERRASDFPNVEVLMIATSGNCELFAMSGERNPYKEAKLGVLQEGAWADMLLVDGDPTKDIKALQDYEHNFVVIIKDGTIYKNTLD